MGFYFSLPVLVSVQADVRNIILFSCHLLSVIVYCQGYHGDSILVSGIGTGVAIVNVKLLELLWKVFYHWWSCVMVTSTVIPYMAKHLEKLCSFNGFSFNHETFPMNYGLIDWWYKSTSMLPWMFSSKWPFSTLNTPSNVWLYTVCEHSKLLDVQRDDIWYDLGHISLNLTVLGYCNWEY